ncbi:MAG: TaqI-like C-terminal specificity domain-containing protein, partial [Aphanizomenon gracile PMC644.10]|nr:TaqI-like C-terminal specificity domain-containing protein [Aphanizomenon gracile PMC644.10]
LETSHIEQVVDLGSGIFDNVTASTVVLALSNRTTTSKTKIITEISDIEKSEFETKIFDQSQFLKNVSYSFNIYMDEKLSNLSKNISNGKKILQSYCRDNIEGIVAHKYLISGEPGDCRVPLVEGKDIKRYFINKPSNFLHWVPEEIHRTRPDYLWYSDNKIVIQRISGGSRPLVCAVDTKKLKTFASTNNLLLKDEFKTYYYFIAALINSDVINWYYANNFSNNSDLTVNISKTFMDQLPIADFSFSVSFISQIIHHLSGDSHYFQFIEIINAATFDIYFPDHMREKEIDVIQFIQRDIEEVMQGQVFENLEDTAKQKVIEQLYTKWTDPDNEVPNRIKLFTVRSPDILKPILESK